MFTRRLMLAALPGLSLCTLARPAAAHSYALGDIEIGHPWSRAAPANITGAGFMTLRNTGTTPDRLVGGSADIARAVEIHTHIHEGGVMRMRPVEGIEIAPGAEVQLAPGGYHLMLIGLKQALRKDDRVPVTLVFERAGRITVELAVAAAGASPGRSGGGHQH
ncbi:copper chaperone PCu(A)C [Teichococcus aestuarii]|nr:copper chaperone PCu(A)C [Pseudoroseomonas aestuarii]